MEIEYYKQYLHCKTVGLRSQAKQNLENFIASFASIAEKEQWTCQLLETQEYEYGNRISYELYEEVVFPALLRGYQNRDSWSVLWLARTAQNLYKAKHLHEQINFKTYYELLKECYLLDPSNAEVHKDLLSVQIRWLQYCIHEYPTGILYGVNGATIDECHEIVSEIEFIRELDVEKIQEKFLNEVQSKVLEYLIRLKKYQTSKNLYEHE
ncbi:hypothetical protein NIES4075_30260 [Tolypothrix sp. NIES-4075]|uniref:hypothetical protein n=1 Tax=Tolypothrix sp. NIES-4075 TaxID=2005459 RepID=UPI000B5C608A|nr:hypothetical protein [Tolypothrix sp. NIES-4075]GAX42028.1 hypothetical protein NIES4075_30260 [Tolypothrix sp. NIES-4075]